MIGGVEDEAEEEEAEEEEEEEGDRRADDDGWLLGLGEMELVSRCSLLTWIGIPNGRCSLGTPVFSFPGVIGSCFLASSTGKIPSGDSAPNHNSNTVPAQRLSGVPGTTGSQQPCAS